MTSESGIRHHPSEPTLLAYATGGLELAAGLVVEAHLAVCPECRRWVLLMEAMGGLLIEDLPPSQLAPGALERTMARLGELPGGEQTLVAPPASRHTGSISLPPPLHGLRVGRLHRLGSGTRHTVLLRSPGGWRLHLLQVRPGVALPRHAHCGTELTYVIAGAFKDEIGYFGPGDLAEVEGGVRHQPVAVGPVDCICLLATGGLRFSSVLHRLLQPFTSF
jgi:putative transcriptional regulator